MAPCITTNDNLQSMEYYLDIVLVHNSIYNINPRLNVSAHIFIVIPKAQYTLNEHPYGYKVFINLMM